MVQINDPEYKSNFLEEFIKKNLVKESAFWPRFLSLDQLETIHQETKINQLTLTPSSFRHFVKRYGNPLNHKNKINHIAHLEVGKLTIINPVAVIITTNSYNLRRGLKKKEGESPFILN